MGRLLKPQPTHLGFNVLKLPPPPPGTTGWGGLSTGSEVLLSFTTHPIRDFQAQIEPKAVMMK